MSTCECMCGTSANGREWEQVGVVWKEDCKNNEPSLVIWPVLGLDEPDDGCCRRHEGGDNSSNKMEGYFERKDEVRQDGNCGIHIDDNAKNDDNDHDDEEDVDDEDDNDDNYHHNHVYSDCRDIEGDASGEDDNDTI
ncbi:hypothetical protein PoB_005579600 [Plakobranchus ocellatus]|uniref:Uncharacterized protein n=1 Tax=Plakobranchus ocellatus TaxID=259542 RepID=A0AAV4C1Q0_9GAST|nr:hypothetical protein PoB_005579600 [Plakobranchus ocellatus]